MKAATAFLFTVSFFSAASSQETSCSAVHVLAARGSGEPQGLGGQGRLITNATRTIPGTTTEAVVYPAVLSPYPPSQSAGIQAAKDQLTKYVEKCPKSKVILMGYSQVRKITRDWRS
jgi:acetylxylan esterase